MFSRRQSTSFMSIFSSSIIVWICLLFILLWFILSILRSSVSLFDVSFIDFILVLYLLFLLVLYFFFFFVFLLFLKLNWIYIQHSVIRKRNLWDSSNINEVIRTVLNFWLFFTKRFHKHKKVQNRLQQRKTKNAYNRHLRGKKLLIRLFAFCAFAWLCFYAFSAFNACKIFL